MILFPPTIIIRHRKENLKKCSLKGLEKRDDMIFYSYPLKKELGSFSNYVVLSFDAPLLTAADKEKGIILLDGTWRYAEKMLKQIPKLHALQARSLPSQYYTAYPREQTNCPYPKLGLASIEALFITYRILQRKTEHLLDHYPFKEKFLIQNNILQNIEPHKTCEAL